MRGSVLLERHCAFVRGSDRHRSTANMEIYSKNAHIFFLIHILTFFGKYCIIGTSGSGVPPFCAGACAQAGSGPETGARAGVRRAYRNAARHGAEFLAPAPADHTQAVKKGSVYIEISVGCSSY